MKWYWRVSNRQKWEKKLLVIIARFLEIMVLNECLAKNIYIKSWFLNRNLYLVYLAKVSYGYDRHLGYRKKFNLKKKTERQRRWRGKDGVTQEKNEVVKVTSSTFTWPQLK